MVLGGLAIGCAPSRATISSNAGIQKDSVSVSPLDLICQVLNGEDVRLEDPFANSIVGLINMEKGSLCTGTLIDRRHVLTAAHCLPNQVTSLRVFTGLSKKDKTSVLDAVAFAATPEWSTRSSEEFDRGDLAVVSITGDLPPSAIPVQWIGTESLERGTEVLIAGYGRTDGVQKKGAGTLRKGTVVVENPLHGRTEVVFDQRQGRGACHGDSGGPAFLATTKGYYQWGVTSREYLDLDKSCTQYSIYTKVTPYLAWIESQVRDL